MSRFRDYPVNSALSRNAGNKSSDQQSSSYEVTRDFCFFFRTLESLKTKSDCHDQINRTKSGIRLKIGSYSRTKCPGTFSFARGFTICCFIIRILRNGLYRLISGVLGAVSYSLYLPNKMGLRCYKLSFMILINNSKQVGT